MHLARHPFPGNVREFENLLHRAVALSGGDTIDVGDLALPGDAPSEAWVTEAMPPPLPTDASVPMPPATSPIEPPRPLHGTASAAASLPSDLAVYLDDIERDMLLRALEQHRFNRTAAGASLGLSLRQMRYRMARLHVMDGADAHLDAERGNA